MSETADTINEVGNCVHHWLLGQPYDGGHVDQECKLCGEQRTIPPPDPKLYLTNGTRMRDADWADRLHRASALMYGDSHSIKKQGYA